MKELWIEKNGETKHVCVADDFDITGFKIVDEPIIEREPEPIEDESKKNNEEENIKLTQEQKTLEKLYEIDFKTVRPLRAILAKTDTEEDWAKLRELEEEAEKLRGELDE